MIDLTAIYVLWLREFKRFYRARSRFIGSLMMPLFFLFFMGFGFTGTNVAGVPEGVDYLAFLVPGIIGMVTLFGSMMGGMSVLWDREFGFLKEIMVAPVSRVSIVLGRIAGGMTISMLQGLMILTLSTFIGFSIPGPYALLQLVILLILVSMTFLGLGLVFASNMKDLQGFQLVMNFVVFPLFFLSGALFPVENLPSEIQVLSYLNPLTYGIDGMRAVLVGASTFTLEYDLMICAAASVVMVLLGAYFFERNDSV